MYLGGKKEKKIQGHDSSQEGSGKNLSDGGSSRGETEKGEGSSPSKLCNPECIIHHL